MPYVSIYGQAPNKFQLGQYARAVRAGAGMGAFGMGQDDSDPDTWDLGTSSTPAPTMPVVTPVSPVTVTSSNPSDYTFAATQAAAESAAAGLDTSLGSAWAAATSPTAGGGFNIAAFMNSLTASAGSAVKLYNSTQAPSLIPGTSAIYDPATGQILGGGLTSGSMSSLLLYGGLALGAYLLISMVKK